MKKLLLILTIASAIFLCCAMIADNHKAPAPLKEIEFTETETVTEWHIPVMTFTSEEADSLLSRLQTERIAAEKAAAIRRMSVYSPGYFQRAGRIWWGGWSWTYYSERILPGYGLRIPGRYTDSLGYVRDGNGYLCLASDVHRKGTVMETPFGSYGKVYDCGCGNNYTVDVYVGW